MILLQISRSPCTHLPAERDVRNPIILFIYTSSTISVLKAERLGVLGSEKKSGFFFISIVLRAQKELGAHIWRDCCIALCYSLRKKLNAIETILVLLSVAFGDVVN